MPIIFIYYCISVGNILLRLYVALQSSRLKSRHESPAHQVLVPNVERSKKAVKHVIARGREQSVRLAMPPKDVQKKKRGSSLKRGRGKKAPDSSASKDPPLLPLRFPEKLWMIVNDCKSDAISWSVDGSAIAIDYMKFQVGYLKNRPDIFKTKNISSFLRQLNMYGFKKISPPCSLDSEKTGLHYFRNRSFAKGRPDLLPEVNRKSVELWSKAKKHHESLYKAAFQNCNCGIMQYQVSAASLPGQHVCREHSCLTAATCSYR
ncbi:heat shock factor protein 5-like [Rhipicephalus microplus]|uniref:heat shock factor protein 5-like n=1 Tax=Rhipicephalus microplus TaxID=6941 RepID=UPI003F6BB359